MESRTAHTHPKKYPSAPAPHPPGGYTTDLQSRGTNFWDTLYSGALGVYFLKKKSGAVRAAEQFLADTAPYGTVKRLRSDNGGEYISEEFKALPNKQSQKELR